ncbi:MAG: phosphopyruvate hydratase [Sedimentibacter sp.]|nr:phosphopyruvate hydratase [Sedimentibacter sp.]
MESKIKQVKARQVLDSKGRPVVEVDVITEDGYRGRAGASTGSSVGINESFVMRDGNPKLFGGMSVYRAIEKIERIIAPAIIGKDVNDQEAIDRIMIELDGTRLKTNLGGNAIFAVSVAVARAAAAVKNTSLYRNMATNDIKYIFTPASNIVNGGSYHDKTLAFQEFMIMPYDVPTINDAIRIIVEVFQHLGDVIKKNNNGRPANMGNYSGYGAPSDDPFEVLDLISKAVSDLGYENNVVYSIDCASSEFYDEKENAYLYRGKLIDREEIIKVLIDIANKYPIAFIEDALQEEDFEGFKFANQRINSVIIGDDFICTSLDRAKKAVEMGAARGMIFKPNQAGTLTEALETARYMMDKGMLVVPSGRAGGVLDSPEKEIGLALGTEVVKSGAPRSGERTDGLNFAIRAAEEFNIPMVNIKELPYFKHLKK